MPYTFIDHTGDVAVALAGDTVADLFEAAAQALTDTLTDLRSVGRPASTTLGLEAATLEDLLVDWLNELLYRFEVHGLLVAVADVSVRQVAGERWSLAATLHGEPFDPARHPARVLVKSATYHGLTVAERGGQWSARMVLDI